MYKDKLLQRHEKGMNNSEVLTEERRTNIYMSHTS